MMVLLPLCAWAASPRPDFPTTDRWADIVAVSGNRAYIGGNFSALGSPFGGFAVVDTTSGALLPTPRVAGAVLCATDDGSGGFFLGGSFTAIDGRPRKNLAHVLRDGTISPWDPGSDGAVRQLIRDQDHLYLGGDFAHVATSARTYLAAVDTASGAVLDWAPAASGPVLHLLLRDGSVYFHSDVPRTSGPPQQDLGAADAVTGQVTPFHLHLQGVINGFEVRDTVAYIGGVFDSVAGVARLNLAAVGIPSGATTSWAPRTNPPAGPHGTPPTVLDVVAHGGRIYLAGAFSEIDAQPRPGIAAVTVGTGALLPWQPSGVTLGGFPIGLTSAGDRVCLRVGVTPTTPASPAAFLVDTLAGVARAWDPLLQGAASLATLSGDRLALAGPFLMVDPRAHHHLAAIDLGTGRVLDWSATADGNVFSIAAADTVVYVGGEFTHVNGIERHGLAALSASTGAVLPWDPLPAPQPYVATWALAVQGGRLQAGLQIDLQQHLVSLDRGSTPRALWSQDLDLPVSTLHVDGTRLYAGGFFRRIGGVDRLAIAALDGETGALQPWAPRVTLAGTDPAGVLAIAVQGGAVYLGGIFQRVGGLQRTTLAAVDAGTGSVLPWSPELHAPPGVAFGLPSVSALEISGSRLYAGGAFETGPPERAMAWSAAWNADPALTPTAALPWVAGLDDEVDAVRAVGGHVYVLGHFAHASGYRHMGIAGIDTTLDGIPPQPPEPGPAPTVSLRAFPNPSQAAVSFEWDVPAGARVRLTLFDLQGRRVAQLADVRSADGTLRWTWDGRVNGRRPGSGLYLVRAEGNGRSSTRRVIRLP